MTKYIATKHRLSDYLSKKMLSLVLLGFSSGLPLALSVSLLQAWFKISGKDLISISLLSLIGQPYVYRFIWAPLLDHYNSPLFNFLGRRKGWILFLQLLIILIISIMAHLSPATTPVLLTVLGLSLATASATQDIVIDAYRVEVLNCAERGLGSALFIEGYRLAMLISSGVGFMLADNLGWKQTYLIMAVFMLLGIIGTFIAATENRVAPLAKVSIIRAAIESIKCFLKREKAIYLLSLVGVYKLSDVLSHALTTMFLLDLNFSLTAIGTINKVVSMVATLIGVMLAGCVMIRINLYKSILFFGCLQGITNILYMILTLGGKNLYITAGVVFIENLCSGMGTSAFLALLTGLCDKRFAATQFALLASLAAGTRIYVGSIAGWLVKFLGWNKYYLFAALMALPSIGLIIYLNQQIKACDPRSL